MQVLCEKGSLQQFREAPQNKKLHCKAKGRSCGWTTKEKKKQKKKNETEENNSKVELSELELDELEVFQLAESAQLEVLEGPIAMTRCDEVRPRKDVRPKPVPSDKSRRCEFSDF